MDGENTGYGVEHNETELEPQLGTEGNGKVKAPANPDDRLQLDAIITNFQTNTSASVGKTTQQHYIAIFKKLLRRSGLLERVGKVDRLVGTPTRRLFSGQQGRRLVLSFVQTVDKRSWNLHRAALKKVWEEGLGVTWPLHARDLACAEYYEAKNAPPIKSVVSWAEAVEIVKDPWTKLMLLLFWQYGLRPSHLASFKWRNIERTAEGEPFAIFALERGFKKQSPVRAVLFPNVKQALLEWEKISPNMSPEAPLLCWRDAFGHLDGSRPTYPDQLRKHWINIQKDRELPVLQLNAPRHFVARTTDKAALSEVATNFLMGHKVTKDVSHRRDYRCEAVEVCLEEQLRVFPNGPLGWLSEVKVETAGLPKELLSLVAAFWQGQEAMTVMQFADQVDKLQRLEKQRQQKAEQQVEVPKLGL